MGLMMAVHNSWEAVSGELHSGALFVDFQISP